MKDHISSASLDAVKGSPIARNQQLTARILLRPTIGLTYWAILVLCIVLFGSSTNALQVPQWPLKSPVQETTATARCEQARRLFPSQSSAKLDIMDKILSSSAFEKGSIKRLSNAVRIPTQSYDDLGPIGEDKRWDVMYDFEAYLKKTYPLTFTKLEVENVNVHGLFLTWAGSDESLKPTLLMAHQDVVPVANDTIKSWKFPPWSGHYDGEYIWGRGSSDCKNQLTAILDAVEMLIKADFTPKRTIVLSFGFDEEVSGPQGAGHLAPAILKRFGKDSLAVIVDEGAGFDTKWGAKMAMPGVGEKGHIDVDITIRMPGGHSSIPSDHTSIGVMSELIELIEANPYTARLHDENPYLGTLHCGAEHGADFPDKLRKILEDSTRSTDELAHEAAKESLGIRYLMQTSQAVDIINGGVKVNALPDRVTMTINQRVNVGEACQSVEDKLAGFAGQIAKKHNLTLHAFDGVEEASSIMVNSRFDKLEPAPITPTEVGETTAYSVLSGTVRALYGEEVIVSPGLMTGNTDTRVSGVLARP